jgi:hypothetical protein
MEMRNILETGEKAILVRKWQKNKIKTWLNCVLGLGLCGSQDFRVMS